MNLRSTALACLLAFGISSAQAALLHFSFSDPVGDHAGTVDVTGLDFTFDSVTGAYTIDLHASPAHPFVGSFRINVNLFNPDTGTLNPVPSFFSDTGNDITLIAPTTVQTISGVNANLLSWDIGDQVAIGSAAFGNPDGISAFGSEVRDLPGGPFIRDMIGTTDNINNGAANVVAVITPLLPEPPTALLLSFGALLLARPRLRTRLHRASIGPSAG